MKKTFRNLLLALMLVVATVCAGLLGACGEAGGTPEGNFVVTVLYPDGTAVNGTTDGTLGATETQLYVQICDAANEENCYLPQPVDANGKMTINASTLAEGLNNTTQYKVVVQGLPATYTAEEVIYEVSSNTNQVTITLQAA